MKCKQCNHADSKVIESRDTADNIAIRRRRECIGCGHRFTTYERIERPHLIVVKRDGTRELFNRQKLLGGLIRACEKTKVTSLQLENLVSDIEQELQELGNSEVKSFTVGELIMRRLAKLDEVAYVRFASVYRRFKDIASFEKELYEIKRHNAELVKD